MISNTSLFFFHFLRVMHLRSKTYDIESDLCKNEHGDQHPVGLLA